MAGEIRKMSIREWIDNLNTRLHSSSNLMETVGILEAAKLELMISTNLEGVFWALKKKSDEIKEQEGGQ